MKFFNYALIAFLEFTRPLLGPASCKFPVSCGEFAILELKEKRLFSALWSIIKRILLCNPFYKNC